MARARRRFLHPTNIALVAVVVTLLAAVAAAYLLIYTSERSQRLEQDRAHWESQIDLVEGFIAESLAKYRYQDVEEFLIGWARDHPRILSLSATFPDGIPLAEFSREQTTSDQRTQTHVRDVVQQGHTRLRLEMVVDTNAIHRQFVALGSWFAAIALGFAVVLALLITFIVRRLALHPLEAAWMSESYRQQDQIRMLATVADGTDSAVIIGDANGRVTWVNQGFARHTGFTLAEVAGLCMVRIVPSPDADSAALDAYAAAVRDARPFRGELVRRTRSGGWCWVDVTMQPVRSHAGAIERFVAIETDITRRKHDEIALRRAANVFHNTVEGILITDADGIIQDVNPAFTEITGYSAAEAVGANPRLLKSDHHDPDFYGAMWRSLVATGVWRGEIWNRRKNGELYLEHQTITRIPAEDGATGGYVAIFSDITEVRRKDEHIAHLAYHDPLTGLPNRALLLDRLDQSLAQAARDGQRLAVLFLDLDRFKTVNDTMGHDKGDDLLIRVAERLTALLRTTDTLCRLGGDEFVVVLHNPSHEYMVSVVAERIIAAVNEPVDLAGTRAQVGTSLGIALFPADGADSTTLMKKADTAMYAAKDAGRNTFRYFNEGMMAETLERLRLEADLRRAIDGDQFEMFVQPRACLLENRVAGVEALLRWHHPERGLILPGDFIPIAEESGLITGIGNWVLDRVCDIVDRLDRAGLGDLKVSVNISAIQFRDAHFAAALTDRLVRHDIPPARIELELTESTIMADAGQAIQVLEAVSRKGMTVAVDDFGTGYSSLSHLRRLPIDAIKIDRSFVRDAHRDPVDGEIVRTIIGLGRSLGLIVIAEGVELPSHLDLLIAAGCHQAQGFHIAPPMTVTDFLAWQARNPGWGPPTPHCATCDQQDRRPTTRDTSASAD